MQITGVDSGSGCSLRMRCRPRLGTLELEKRSPSSRNLLDKTCVPTPAYFALSNKSSNELSLLSEADLFFFPHGAFSRRYRNSPAAVLAIEGGRSSDLIELSFGCAPNCFYHGCC